MDSLTQIAVGVATVEALAGKKLQNKSFVIGALLGTVPDLDVWIGKLFAYEIELAFHRSFTHSILGIVLMSPLFAWLLRRWRPALSFTSWTVVVAATFATHVLIDLFTSWGVQLLYPLTERFSFKTIFVVDIVYTLPWLICLGVVFRSKQLTQRRKWLWRGFVTSSCYLILTVLIKLYVVEKAALAIEKQGIIAQDFIVKPTVSNCILWNINIKAEDAFYIGDYSLFDTQDIRFTKYPRETAPAQALVNEPVVATLSQVSEGWYTITPYQNGSYAFNDLRFGLIEKDDLTTQFVFAYELLPTVNGYEVQPLPKTIRDGKGAMQKVWNRLKGN